MGQEPRDDSGLTAKERRFAELLCKGARIAASRCLQLTKSRQQDAADLRLMIEAFCDELAEFPCDAVVYAFRQWARREKWWPSLSEIRAECQRASKWRKSLLKALAA